MKTIILNKLAEIEQQHGIRILFACESGSRGWEFPSPDSDYDVRFIYARPLSHYLSVAAREDHLSFPINDELDVYGWDIRKVLQLTRKSNTTPFEWLQSPIVYREVPGFRDELWQLCQQYFNQRSNIHHYLGIAQGALDTIVNEDEIRIKKLFYVLRPLLAALWCLERKSIAPMKIGPLMDLLPDTLQTQVSALIALKAGTPEGYTIRIDPALKAYIDETFRYCSEASKTTEKQAFPLEDLDRFFLKTISNDDDTRVEK